ncbi:MAG: hypothetical protein E6J78_04330 [Deltaproteobacteria bacterium]|nr:MAG: hypothetical protein E6J78_04330 [Deltaproteobacteria bacterium]
MSRRGRRPLSLGKDPRPPLQGGRGARRVRALRHSQAGQGQAAGGRVREVPQGDGDTLSFGAYLKRSRALRELSAEQVARLTRLPLRIVTALEAEDWPALQDRRHALFVARSCASAIGLDPDETALRLEEELQLSQPPLPQRTPLWKRLWQSRPREPAVWLVLCLTAAACLSVLLLRR